MWTAGATQLAGGRIIKMSIVQGSSAVAFADALRLWQTDESWRSFFIALLAESPFSAFRWETPPITAATVSRAFEFVLLDSPGLAARPDADAFAEHFRTAAPLSAVEFQNLGRDATLIAPHPSGPHSAYGHLAAFVRHAPQPQQHALWQLVGSAVERRLSVKPVWLSTAGAGVSWLHVRLDDRPKYYGYAPYRDL